jgi:hypothetical protein
MKQIHESKTELTFDNIFGATNIYSFYKLFVELSEHTVQ